MGLTWGQFKHRVEAQGVTDEDRLWVIDVDPAYAILVTRDSNDGELAILDTGQAETIIAPD